MTVSIVSRFRSVACPCANLQTRSFFYWVTRVFNSVDREKIEKYGPDRACAEWLLRNGASVRWKGTKEPLTDYNRLAAPEISSYIEGVIAVNAGISHHGFPHFQGCKYIKDIKIEDCRYINDKALPLLSYLEDSLNDLHIAKCSSVTEDGLYSLKALKNLKNLKLESLTSVSDEGNVLKELKNALPECNIKFI